MKQPKLKIGQKCSGKKHLFDSGNTCNCGSVSFVKEEPNTKSKEIEKLNNNQGVKLSGTVSGQRELLREYRNKINELIQEVNKLKSN